MLSKSRTSVFLALWACARAAQLAPPDEYEKEFEKFIVRFGKKYTDAERPARLQTFTNSYKLIASENANPENTATFAINHMADMDMSEIQRKYMGWRPAPNSTGGVFAGSKHLGTHRYSGAALAASVDWRQQGAVTPVKNQGQCGSCWSFSATGAMEGAWKIAGNSLIPLSEKQLMDCNHDPPNNGCGGGNSEVAFNWEQSQNVCTEASYPYSAQDGQCRSGCTTGIPQGGIVGHKDVEQDTNALMEAVSKQPVSIALDAAAGGLFQHYRGGILAGMCGQQLDHAVLIVGYGTENSQDYWIVKNSWGSSMGENGYWRLLRGKGGPGECGLKAQAVYPVARGGPAPSPPGPPSPPYPPSPPGPPSPPFPPSPPGPPSPSGCSCTNGPSCNCQSFTPCCTACGLIKQPMCMMLCNMAAGGGCTRSSQADIVV